MNYQETWIDERPAESSEMSILAERAGALIRIRDPSFLLVKPQSYSPYIPPLPLELIVRVLKHLIRVDEPNWVQNIQACSLVCSDWLQLARSHLFHTIIVTDGHRTKDFQAFGHVLQHSPAIFHCIRVLSLQADRMLSRPSTSVTADMIHAVLSHLPNLSCLDVSGLRFDASQMEVSRPVHCHRLSRLRIVNQRSWTSIGRDLLDVLSLFTVLNELTLENVGELKDSVCSDNEFGSMFTEEMISSLYIPGSCAIAEVNLYSVSQLHFYFEIFKRMRSVETIRTLSVSCGHPVQIPGFARDLGRFFAQAGKHIRQLSIELSGCFRTRLHEQVAEDCHTIFRFLLPGLSQLQSLRTFGLLILFPHDPTIPKLTWQLLVATLAALPPTVQRFQLCLQLDPYSKRLDYPPYRWESPWLAPQLDWESLRRVLERFGRLEVVRFVKSSTDKTRVVLSELGDDEKQWIAHHLPELRDRQALLFDPLE